MYNWGVSEEAHTNARSCSNLAVSVALTGTPPGDATTNVLVSLLRAIRRVAAAVAKKETILTMTSLQSLIVGFSTGFSPFSKAISYAQFMCAFERKRYKCGDGSEIASMCLYIYMCVRACVCDIRWRENPNLRKEIRINNLILLSLISQVEVCVVFLGWSNYPLVLLPCWCS